jgi:hypothetical protein
MMTTRLIADFDNTLNDALNGVVEAEAALGRMYRAALARVAELEAALAAQQWQPVTEEWPPYQQRVLIGHGDYYVYGWYVIARRAYTNKDIWVMDDDTVLAFESATVAMIVPPLPPDAAEATE